LRRASLAAAAALLAVGCGKELIETRSLSFDPETTAGALGSGWSGWEKGPDGDTFVWAQSRQATVRVLCKADGDRLVRFRCWPFRFPGAGPQQVTLFVNDAKIDSTILADPVKVYTFATPRAVWKPGLNELRLEFAYADSPKDRMAGSDTRTLAAAFDWLEVVPPAPPPEEKKP